MTTTVLIIGAGIAGLAAATQLGEAGAQVIVVEHSATIGGPRAALFDATNGHPDLAKIGTLKELYETANIDILTLANIHKISGKAGQFVVSVQQQARFVTDACTLCNHCPTACPQVVSNDFDAGLSYRKAIHTPMRGATPETFVIDIENCLNVPPNYLPCQHCVEVCDDNAINFDMPLKQFKDYPVAAIIVTIGFDSEDNDQLEEFGYGLHPDIVNSMELQRLLESPGPTGGYVAKPSNEKYPQSILLVLQKVTAFEAHILTEQVQHLLEQNIEDITVLILEQKNTIQDFNVLTQLANVNSIKIIWAAWLGITEGMDNSLVVNYVDLQSNAAQKQNSDMVVLSSYARPCQNLANLAQQLDLKLNPQGYIDTFPLEDINLHFSAITSRAGVFTAGGATGPVSLAQSLTQANRASLAVLDYTQKLANTQTDLRSNDVRTNWVAANNSHSDPNNPTTQRLADIEKILESLIILGEQ